MTHSLISSDTLSALLEKGRYQSGDKKKINNILEEVFAKLTCKKTKLNIPALSMINGPSGSGKSTFYKSMVLLPEHQGTVFVDQDDIRNMMEVYNACADEYLALGFSREAADKFALDKWNCAALYIGYSAINQAHAAGFRVARVGVFNKVSDEIYYNAKANEIAVTTLAFFAPYSVCFQSVTQRFEHGGHPVKEKYFRDSYDSFPLYLCSALDSSHALSIYWRNAVNDPPLVIARHSKETGLIVANHSGFSQFADEFKSVSMLHDFLENSVARRPRTIQSKFIIEAPRK